MQGQGWGLRAIPRSEVQGAYTALISLLLPNLLLGVSPLIMQGLCRHGEVGYQGGILSTVLFPPPQPRRFKVIEPGGLSDYLDCADHRVFR